MGENRSVKEASIFSFDLLIIESFSTLFEVFNFRLQFLSVLPLLTKQSSGFSSTKDW